MLWTSQWLVSKGIVTHNMLCFQPPLLMCCCTPWVLLATRLSLSQLAWIVRRLSKPGARQSTRCLVLICFFKFKQSFILAQTLIILYPNETVYYIWLKTMSSIFMNCCFGFYRSFITLNYCLVHFPQSYYILTVVYIKLYDCLRVL